MTDLQKRLIAILTAEEEEKTTTFGFIRINAHEEDNKVIHNSTISSWEYD